MAPRLLALALLATTLVAAPACSPKTDANTPTTTQNPEDAEKAAALAAAQAEIKSRIPLPDTALFPQGGIASYNFTKVAEGHWTIAGNLDHKNQAGASLRADWTAEMKKRPDGTWETVSANLTPRS